MLTALLSKIFGFREAFQCTVNEKCWTSCLFYFFVMTDLVFYYVHLWLGQEGVHVWVRGEEGGGQWGGGGVF